MAKLVHRDRFADACASETEEASILTVLQGSED
jgi:hypothetical protein